MISRLVLSIGAVAASVGLLLVGMATSYSPEDGGMRDLGLVFMIGGAIAVAIGIAWYRRSEEALEADAVARHGPNRD
jgi:drug/metabolite transporter (DMT)-like permease